MKHEITIHHHGQGTLIEITELRCSCGWALGIWGKTVSSEALTKVANHSEAEMQAEKKRADALVIERDVLRYAILQFCEPLLATGELYDGEEVATFEYRHFSGQRFFANTIEEALLLAYAILVAQDNAALQEQWQHLIQALVRRVNRLENQNGVLTNLLAAAQFARPLKGMLN